MGKKLLIQRLIYSLRVLSLVLVPCTGSTLAIAAPLQPQDQIVVPGQVDGILVPGDIIEIDDEVVRYSREEVNVDVSYGQGLRFTGKSTRWIHGELPINQVQRWSVERPERLDDQLYVLKGYEPHEFGTEILPIVVLGIYPRLRYIYPGFFSSRHLLLHPTPHVVFYPFEFLSSGRQEFPIYAVPIDDIALASSRDVYDKLVNRNAKGAGRYYIERNLSLEQVGRLRIRAAPTPGPNRISAHYKAAKNAFEDAIRLSWGQRFMGCIQELAGISHSMLERDLVDFQSPGGPIIEVSPQSRLQE